MKREGDSEGLRKREANAMDVIGKQKGLVCRRKEISRAEPGGGRAEGNEQSTYENAIMKPASSYAGFKNEQIG